jgi:hypothetical protein
MKHAKPKSPKEQPRIADDTDFEQEGREETEQRKFVLRCLLFLLFRIH